MYEHWNVSVVLTSFNRIFVNSNKWAKKGYLNLCWGKKTNHINQLVQEKGKQLIACNQTLLKRRIRNKKEKESFITPIPWNKQHKSVFLLCLPLSNSSRGQTSLCKMLLVEGYHQRFISMISKVVPETNTVVHITEQNSNLHGNQKTETARGRHGEKGKKKKCSSYLGLSVFMADENVLVPMKCGT